MKEAKEFTGFYIEKTDLIDYAQTEEEAKEMVAKLTAKNDDDCVYKYSAAMPEINEVKDRNDAIQECQDLIYQTIPTGDVTAWQLIEWVNKLYKHDFEKLKTKSQS